MSPAEKPDAKDDSYRHLSFVMKKDISLFFPLLQLGGMVRSRVGCSVMTFLSEEMEISRETIEKIQSIFLDGSPVDDLESAMVKDGSVLALSAAMPGLVGATLRRSGAYSSFRSGITYHETGEHCASGEGFVRIKLFNLLMAELGPGLLKKGIFIESSLLMDFLRGQSEDFWQGCREVFIDDKSVDSRILAADGWTSGEKEVFLSVKDSN
jgi:hypothetical protein